MDVAAATIKRASIKDADLVSHLSSETFYETFAGVNTKENMDKYLSEKFNLTAIKEELSDNKTVFFIAFANNKAVGYAKLRENKTPEALNKLKTIEIERIYVYRSHQKLKVGAALMEKSISHAKENKFDVVWLGVWENNPNAIDFYKRWGFDIFGKHVFVLGNDPQNDLLMKKHLT